MKDLSLEEKTATLGKDEVFLQHLVRYQLQFKDTFKQRQTKLMKKKCKPIYELIQTEENYVEQISLLISKFELPMMKEEIITED